jgi:hypothetical protein
MKLFKIPKKTEKELIIFFKKNQLGIIVKKYLLGKKNLHHGKFITQKSKPYPPILDDLFKLFYIITKFKRLTCLEFGTGWSTLVINQAMTINKNKYLNKISDLRISNPFEIYSLDNIKKFLSLSKKRMKNHKTKTHFLYSQNKMCLWNGQMSNEYLKLPSINPDFIYIDGPDHTCVDGEVNGLKMSNNDFMPMNSDILKIEHFLTPGTIILIDGRTSNANFLRNNFKRNWLYDRDDDRDHSIFILNDKPIGVLNRKQIKFYFNKN